MIGGLGGCSISYGFGTIPLATAGEITGSIIGGVVGDEIGGWAGGLYFDYFY